MKRSEMIQKIVEKIELMRGVDNGYYVYPEDDIIANTILTEIEDAGMPAPFCHDIYYKVWRNGGSGNQWEVE